MARIRSIKPEFWSSEQVMELSRDARLLFIGLWNFCDDEGRMTFAPKQIKALVFPGDDLSAGTVTDMLEELADRGLIETYEVDDKRFLAVTGWRRHQKIDRPQPARCPPPVDELQRAGVEPSRGFVDHSTNARDGEEGKGEEKEKTDSRSLAGATRPGAGDEFDTFWSIRLRRDGPDPREPARREFAKAVKQGTDPPKIVEGMRHYAQMHAEKSGSRFVARTEKWLRERTWEDYQPLVAIDPKTAGLVWLRSDDARFKAWDQHHRATRGRGLPTDNRGGWSLPAEWPPGHPKAGAARAGAQAALPLGPTRIQQAGGANDRR